MTLLRLQQMLKRDFTTTFGACFQSNKTRNEFYDDMLAEAGIEIEIGDIKFGAKAIALHLKATTSMHREHLLVHYAVELYLKVYEAVNPRSSLISGEKLEMPHRHFESRIQLMASFYRHFKDDGHFKHCARHRALP